MKRTPSAMRGHAFHFLRYGIGFLVAHLLLIVLGLWAWDALLEDRTEAGLLAEMRGTHALLQHRFAEPRASSGRRWRANWTPTSPMPCAWCRWQRR